MLFSIDRHSVQSIQEQLRSKIVAAILNGQLTSGAVLPSTRVFASHLGISRTTVVIVYDKLVEDGFLLSSDRSGFKVHPKVRAYHGAMPESKADDGVPARAPNWSERSVKTPGQQRNIVKPADWQNYPYPFVYGQPDPSLFPLAAWRECSRQAMSAVAMRDWSSDAIAQDDPYLIHEIRSKLLPRRGIYAGEDEILITSGGQNALFLIAMQLMGPGITVGIEDPGYPDARNIFDLQGASLLPVGLDQQGAVIDEKTRGCDYLFLTPSHQSPTTVTLSKSRRKDILALATTQDQILIEDDFESETNFLGDPVPALKAEDTDGRVIYVGSLSKSTFPGLRLGYVVAPPALISELRALRRLMLRHAPSNNQRTTSLFIGQGHHDSYIRKLNRIYRERWQVMKDSIDDYLPGMSKGSTFGGTSFWLKGEAGLDANELAERALEQGIVIEPGQPHFMQSANNKHYFRLGFSSIGADRIREGIRLLSILHQNSLAG